MAISPIKLDIRCIPLFAREEAENSDKWYTTYINNKHKAYFTF